MIVEHHGQILHVISSFSADILQMSGDLPDPDLVWGRVSCSAALIGDEQEILRMGHRTGREADTLGVWLQCLDPGRLFWGKDVVEEIQALGLVGSDYDHVLLLEYVAYHRELVQFIGRSLERDMIPADLGGRLIASIADYADPYWIEQQMERGELLPSYAGNDSPWNRAVRSALTPA